MTKKVVRKKITQILLAALILVLWPFLETGSYRVNAQNEMLLTFEPANSDLVVGDSSTVTVEVNSGSNLNAYDITISYDANIINLESWSHGSYLSNLAVLINENQPGLLHLVVIQLARPGVSGEGTLLNLSFKGVAPGTSEIIIEDAQFATSSSELVIPQVSAGMINVYNYLSPTVTVEATATLTPSLTLTLTRTPTRTPTRTLTRTPTVAGNLPATVSPIPSSASATPDAGTRIPLSPSTTTPQSTINLDPQNEETLSPTNSTGQLIVPRLSSTPKTATSLDENQESGMGITSGKKTANTVLWIIAILLILVLIGLITLSLFRKKRNNKQYT